MLGLATPFHEQNYGTKLQACAMQTIFSNLGYEVEVIDYLHTSSFKGKLKSLVSPSKVANKLKNVKQKKNNSSSPEYLRCIGERNRAFNSFVNGNINTTRPFRNLDELGRYSKRYDAVICGSDQIWLPSHIKNGYYNLSFVPDGVKRIAYAPSLGISSLEQKDRKMYADFLGRFDALSCRENSGCEIINSISEKRAVVVLDPTLMVERDEWERLSGNKRIIDEKYIFCYFLGSNPQHRQKAKELADRLGLKIVALPHITQYVASDESYADLALCNINPYEFINLIKNAEYICTDSFHGSVFSTIFQKNYFVFERFGKDEKGSTNTRLISLLENLGLSDRLIENEQLASDRIYEVLNGHIDYNAVSDKLNVLKKHSMQYITDSLSGIKAHKQTHIEIIDKHDCCGCSACADACPKRCIEMTPDSEGFVYPKVNTDNCISCGACLSVCPVKQYRKGNGSFTAFAAYSKDEKIRRESTSGGVFTHIAEKIIENGGAVIGAAFDENFGVRHIVIDSKSELYRFRSSKYVQSDTLGIYRKTLELLNLGKTVLFSGTPCQIRALRAFLKTAYDNLICVDLFCHGVPSPKTWNRYLETANPDKRKIENISFRDKRISWEKYSLTLSFDDGEKSDFWKDNPYSRGFGFSLFNRPFCSTCQLKSFPRISDITLGDLWKIDMIYPEMNDKKGISFVILNTEKGKKLFDSISNDLVSRGIEPEKLKTAYPVMGVPVKPHKNRSNFFEQVDSAPFDKLAMKYATEDRKSNIKTAIIRFLGKTGLLKIIKKFK